MTTHSFPTPRIPQCGGLADEVVLVSSEPRTTMRFTGALAGMRYKVTAIEAIRAIESAQPLAREAPLAMIVALDGSENVVELRSLLASTPETRFLFLAPEMPPRAPVARILNRYGAAILHESESPVVVVSTLVALLMRQPDEVP